jgi:hypothetical protein
MISRRVNARTDRDREPDTGDAAGKAGAGMEDVMEG